MALKILNEKLAFPSALGFGKYAGVGQSTRSVYLVTNLNDSGTGSFRDACSVANRDIVFFGLSGNIQIKAPRISVPNNIRIHGQTAAGDGIAITSDLIDPGHNGLVMFDGGDGVVRHVRFRRHGDSGDYANADIASMLSGQGYVWDHCSFSWATDDMTSGIYNGGGKITYQYCMLYESVPKNYTLADPNTPQIGTHSKGVAWFGNFGNLSVIGNVFAHIGERTPSISTYDVDMDLELINNIAYNWGSFAATIKVRPAGSTNGNGGSASGTGKIRANVMGNLYIPGNETYPNRGDIITDGDVKMYLKNNIGRTRPDNTRPELDIVKTGGIGQDPGNPSSEVITIYPYNYDESKVIDPVDIEGVALKNYLLPKIGANLHRDSADLKIINDILNGTGHIIEHPVPTLSYPALASGTGITDSTGNGIADDFETAHGLPSGGTGNETKTNWDFGTYQVQNNAGYTNREMYFAYLAGDFDELPDGTIYPPTAGANDKTKGRKKANILFRGI